MSPVTTPLLTGISRIWRAQCLAPLGSTGLQRVFSFNQMEDLEETLNESVRDSMLGRKKASAEAVAAKKAAAERLRRLREEDEEAGGTVTNCAIADPSSLDSLIVISEAQPATLLSKTFRETPQVGISVARLLGSANPWAGCRRQQRRGRVLRPHPDWRCRRCRRGRGRAGPQEGQGGGGAGCWHPVCPGENHVCVRWSSLACDGTCDGIVTQSAENKPSIALWAAVLLCQHCRWPSSTSVFS